MMLKFTLNAYNMEKYIKKLRNPAFPSFYNYDKLVKIKLEDKLYPIEIDIDEIGVRCVGSLNNDWIYYDIFFPPTNEFKLKRLKHCENIYFNFISHKHRLLFIHLWPMRVKRDRIPKDFFIGSNFNPKNLLHKGGGKWIEV